MNTRGITALTACSVTAALALTGCLGGEDGKSDGSSTGGSPPPSTPVAKSSGSAGAKANPDRRPIASRKGSIEDSNVLLEVIELRRSGSTAIFSIRLTIPQGADEVQVASAFDDGIDQEVDGADILASAETLDGITLVDSRNRKRYLVGRDSRGACVCDSELTNDYVEDGVPLELSATYAAPPPGVQAMDVHVPGFGTLHDVPVS
jgi:hypothetical protein